MRRVSVQVVASNTLTLSSSEFSTNKGGLTGAEETAVTGVAADALNTEADNNAKKKGKKRDAEITKMPCQKCVVVCIVYRQRASVAAAV